MTPSTSTGDGLTMKFKVVPDLLCIVGSVLCMDCLHDLLSVSPIAKLVKFNP